MTNHWDLQVLVDQVSEPFEAVEAADIRDKTVAVVADLEIFDPFDQFEFDSQQNKGNFVQQLVDIVQDTLVVVVVVVAKNSSLGLIFLLLNIKL